MKPKDPNAFLAIPYSIQRNKDLNQTQKILLAYLKGWQTDKENKIKYCLYTLQEIAEDLCITLSSIKEQKQELIKKGLIFQKKKGLIDGRNQFKNRMVLIMVDENNPLPTKELLTKEQVISMRPEVFSPGETQIPSSPVVGEEPIQPDSIDVLMEYSNQRRLKFYGVNMYIGKIEDKIRTGELITINQVEKEYEKYDK